MNILLIGAGAVGQVYGKFLQQGGAHVTFMVKEKYRESCEKDLILYWLNRRRNRHTPDLMHGHGVVTSASQVAKSRWDYVFFCMSSTGLRGPWLDELLPATPGAIFVTLQPGINDRDYLTTKIAADRLIEGTIPIVSYTTPMPGETVAKPGIACWIPPFQKAGFSGSTDKLQPLLKTLKRGGLASAQLPDVRRATLVPTVALSLLIAVLESEGWSFEQLKKGRRLKLACQAMHEAIPIVASKLKVPVPPFQFVLTPWLFRLILTASRWVIPFDFETYLRVHFTKVQDQMHQGLKDYIAEGEKAGLPVRSLKEMAALNGAV